MKMILSRCARRTFKQLVQGKSPRLILGGIRLRRGAAAVEMAIVSPILFVIVLAGIQFGGMMTVQNVLTAAAREGCRVGSFYDTSSSQAVITAVRDRLSLGGVDPDLITIVVSPTTLGGLATGAEVSVKVTGLASELAFLWPPGLGSDPTLSATITYHRE